MTDAFTTRDAMRGLFGARVYWFDVVDSTNTLALESGEDGAVFVADTQTAGRGRRGRSWHSARGRGLWFSVALAGSPDGLPFAAALALRDALRDVDGITVRWPNDILLHGRKLSGVLIEHRGNRIALGIGVNVHHQAADFPTELQDTATSLDRDAPGAWRRDALLAAVVEQLTYWIQRLRDGDRDGVFQAWCAACDVCGRRIARDGVTGRVESIAPDGTLNVATSDGPVRIDGGLIRVLEDA